MSDVVATIGKNIETIRKARSMTGGDLSVRLKELGLSMSLATVSEVERGKRKVSAADLLVLAVALNASVIDLLTPEDGSPLQIADGIEPLHPSWLESWLRGEHPWPPKPDDQGYNDQFFESASEVRKLERRIGMRPEIQELSALKSAVAGAVEGPGTWINEIEDPEVMAAYLRDQLERVNAYVKLLADRIEKNGYGG